MKKLVLALLSLFVATSVVQSQEAASNEASITVEAGYNNNYIVNGVARSEGAPFVGIGAIKSLKYGDVYIGGTLLPDDDGGSVDQSHWTLGLGKGIEINEDFSLRLDGTVTRHQAGVVGIPNSTEFGVKAALVNPVVTPYVRYSADIDLDQNGWFVGAERPTELGLWGLVFNPSIEYGELDDYTSVAVKGSLTKNYQTAVGTLTPFAEIGWYDNDFDVANYNFATEEFSGDVVYSLGLRLNF